MSREAHVSRADDRAKPPRGGDAEGWLPETEEIRHRRELAEAMGGPEKVQRQHA